MVLLTGICSISSGAGPVMLNQPIDVSPDFYDSNNTLYVLRKLDTFDPATGRGTVVCERKRWRLGFLFNHMTPNLEKVGANEFPGGEYPVDPALPFSIEFNSPRTVRVRFETTTNPPAQPFESPMLVREPAIDSSWKVTAKEKTVEYSNEFGTVILHKDPWRIELRDASGKRLTTTDAQGGALPFSFVRRGTDFSRSVAATLSLSPGEKIMGLGEQFGPIDKRGQHVVLCTTDVLGAEKPMAYKPVPFYFSNRGYGVFVHTGTPLTADVGAKALSTSTLTIGDDALDMFLFFGNPKEVLGEYTALTGRPPMPPLWSFGLWMSRITYKTEEEVRTVAAKMREHRVPCDVIHLDTGWFQTDWHCDYQFAKDRFQNPQKMIDDLKAQGFHTSLWQLPYFVPKNPLFPELVQKGLAVKDGHGGLPSDDVVLDFTNPQTVAWYQDKLGGLLKMGVGAIKTDFGEAAPYNGVYANGRTGFYEHNLYPLRYQKAVHDITKKVTGEDIIWARAGWAGSQRYPLHWSGDSSTNDGSMAATLRAGISIGASGFTFWSHDIGGFGGRPSPDLYARWAAFGLLTSHSRCHGDPPREPWEYGPAFEETFRKTVELKYRLMPYVYAQSKQSSDLGLPMLRGLFIEFPNDPGSWTIDDEYLLGSSLLVAPILEGGTTSRQVYLPPGEWIDLQTNQRYGTGWHQLEAGPVRAVILVRAGSVLPMVEVAQSTSQIDWKKLTLAVYPAADKTATGLFCDPADNKLKSFNLKANADGSYAAPAELNGAKMTVAK